MLLVTPEQHTALVNSTWAACSRGTYQQGLLQPDLVRVELGRLSLGLFEFFGVLTNQHVKCLQGEGCNDCHAVASQQIQLASLQVEHCTPL